MKSYWIVNERQHAIVRVRARTEKEALTRYARKCGYASWEVMAPDGDEYHAVESDALTALVEIGQGARNVIKMLNFGGPGGLVRPLLIQPARTLDTP